MGLEAIKISEANYPESLRRVFIINGKIFFAISIFLNEKFTVICSSTQGLHVRVFHGETISASGDIG